MNNDEFSLNWKIAGKAGEGVMVIAKIMAKACKRHGLDSYNYLEYPSLIKGGHQTGQVHASTNGATCQKRKLDMLVTMGKNGLDFHKEEITSDTLIIYNANSGPLNLDEYKHLDAKIIEMPFRNLSKDSTGGVMATNMIVLGVSTYFLGMDPVVFKKLLVEEFASKGEKIVEMDITAFEHGYSEAQKLGKPIKEKILSADFSEDDDIEDNQISLTGNEAVGLGAIAAGVQYYSAYPMTPATGLLHYLAAQQDHYPIIVKHVEDEISAINQALGASYAGVRAMTGSSGGGFALMTEAVSFAGIAEIPLVILEAQRTGPATGLPTWTAQADLSFILTAGHGDIERVVLTPGSIEEHFELTKKAFYLAEKFQIPVFILSDKFILESHQTMPRPDNKQTVERQSMAGGGDLPEDDSYRRYALKTTGVETTGISPRSIPGQPHGLQLTNSYEHDEFGFATEDSAPARAQVDKRDRKMVGIKNEIPQPYIVGPKNADVTFVSWGSTVNVLREVVKEKVKENQTNNPESTNGKTPTANAIHIPCVWPFPVEKFTELANNAKKIVMLDGNKSGQAQKLIRQETGISFQTAIRRYDGRPFYTEDLIDWLDSGKLPEEYSIITDNIMADSTDKKVATGRKASHKQTSQEGK